MQTQRKHLNPLTRERMLADLRKAASVGLALATLFLGGVARAESVDHEAYELAFSLAEERCDYMADGWTEDGISEDDVGHMYDACVRLEVPPLVLTPAQHYDMTDGAFWRSGQ